jgi:uncharacterized membrane protein
MNKKLKFVFLASIVVNVLLGGVFLGELPRRFDRDFYRRERMEKALTELPQPVQDRFREKMKQTREDAEPIRDQIRDARDEAIRILAAEPFDEAAYDRQVAKISELRGQFGKRMAGIVKEVAKEATPEQRKALAEMFKRSPAPSAR